MISKTIALSSVILASSFLGGCGSTLPLIFADKTSLGVGIEASEQGVDMVLGFKTKSIAIVPVAVRDKDKNFEKILTSTDGTKTDALSTFGNFNVDTEGGVAAASIGLGRFFATGLAAQNIASKLGEAMVEKAKK